MAPRKGKERPGISEPAVFPRWKPREEPVRRRSPAPAPRRREKVPA